MSQSAEMTTATPRMDPQHRVREHLEAHSDRLWGLLQGAVEMQ